MIADIDLQVIGITGQIVDVELVLTGYVMFRKDMPERKGEVVTQVCVM